MILAIPGLLMHLLCFALYKATADLMRCGGWQKLTDVAPVLVEGERPVPGVQVYPDNGALAEPGGEVLLSPPVLQQTLQGTTAKQSLFKSNLIERPPQTTQEIC